MFTTPTLPKSSIAAIAKQPNNLELAKASALMVKRGIYETLFALRLPTARTMQWWQILARLQGAIFSLDRYGEQHWTLKETTLSEYWSRIEGVSETLGHPATINQGLADIKLYQQIEVEIRLGIPVALKPIDIFYRSKCCDVRLMRRLLADIAIEEGRPVHDLSALDVLDSIEEVEDDLEDLMEDRITFNGNRLLSVCRTSGITYALQEYSDHVSKTFLDSCESERLASDVMRTDTNDGWSRVRESCNRVMKRLHHPTTFEILSFVQQADFTPQVSEQAA